MPSPARLAWMPRIARGLAALAAPLALCVTALLWLQWPLRAAGAPGATVANDTAQVLFALYVAVAVMHAGRRGAHVAAGSAAGGRARRWRRVGTALCVLPWALVLLVTGAPGAWASLRMGEHFPETGNAGYFLIKLAMLLLALLLAVQALQMLRRRRRGPTDRP